MDAGTDVAARCDRCGADRLVEAVGPAWPRRRGRHLRCVGCHHPIGDVPITPIVTTDYGRTRAASARALAGALVVDDHDERTARAALELVRSFTGRDYELAQLRDDRDRGVHEHRLRGELSLLARHVGPGTTRPLLRAAQRVASAVGPPTSRQREVLEVAEHHLQR